MPVLKCPITFKGEVIHKRHSSRRRKSGSIYRPEDLHRDYDEKFLPATTYLRHAKDIGSGKARSLGLGYTASEAIDHLQNMWPHVLEVARYFDYEKWEDALQAVEKAERA